MRLGLSLACTLLASASAFAQPAAKADATNSFDKELDALFSQGGLTADQAAARAPTISPAVAKAAAEIDVAIAQAETAEVARVPRVAATGTYTRLSKVDPIVFGTTTIEIPQNAWAAQGQVNVALSDYFYRYPKLIGAARLGLDAARFTKKVNELDAGQEARVAYYEWVRARMQVLVAARQLTQVQATLGQVRALAEAQRLSTADRMRVESQEAQAEQALDQLKQLAELREEQLRLLIGASPTEQLAIGEDIRTDLGAAGAEPLDQLLATAKAQRLEFRALEIGIEAKEKQRDAETADQLPKLSAFGIADYAKPNSRVTFELEPSWHFTWQAGLQLSWTLNDALIARANKHRIAAEARGLRADRENLERGTRIEVLSAQQAVTLAQRGLITSQKGLAAAEESYRVRQALLAAQRATAVELVDAETELTRARITALDARVDLRVAIAQLRHALGNDVKK